MNDPVYLDHHSTTPTDPRVVEAMMPYFSEVFGNPSAITHEYGRKAATALEEARASVASFFNIRPGEVFFTAGATESNNLVLMGTLRSGDHLITSSIEHKSIVEPARALAERGVELTVLPVDGEGFVDPDRLEKELREETALVSIIWANGEIGTVQRMSEIAALCEKRGIALHSDATQAVGKIPVDLDAVPCHYLSLSAHKIYGPKGIGALIARQGRPKPRAVTAGGGQEKGVRSGTVNVPGAVGLGEALELRRERMTEEAARLTDLRDHLWEAVTGQIEGVSINGPRQSRLPGNLSVTFDRISAEELIMAMRGIAVSSGSACSSGAREPSEVLRAIGLGADAALGTLRIGMGASTTRGDLDTLLEQLTVAVPRLRELSA